MPDERGEQDGKRTVNAPTSPRLADDGFYRALASTRRRRLLSYLLEASDCTVDDLAAVLVGWEVAETGRVAGRADHERTVVELVHVHLPALSDADLVSFDRSTGTVSLVSLDDAVADLIRRSVAAERPGDA